MFGDFWRKNWDWRTVQRSALCRSRRELSNEYLLAKIGVDTAENEPLEIWAKIQFTIHFTPYRIRIFLLRLERFKRSRLKECRSDGSRRGFSEEYLLAKTSLVIVCLLASVQPRTSPAKSARSPRADPRGTLWTSSARVPPSPGGRGGGSWTVRGYACSKSKSTDFVAVMPPFSILV